MKKIIVSLVAGSFLGISLVHADCMRIEDFEPVCGIQGKTFTSNCDGWSDTSSRAVPTLHEGACKKYPSLSYEARQLIIDGVSKALFEYIEYSETYRLDKLNREGGEFVRSNVFPKIQQLLLDEREKQEPNLLRISILHHIAAVIGYDYIIITDPNSIKLGN